MHRDVAVFLFLIQSLCFLDGHRLEADLLIGLPLYQLRNVDTDDRRDLRIATGGLSISEQDDRLTMRRHLDGAERDPL